MGYIVQKLWDILAKTMGYIRKNYGIYWSNTIYNFMGCIRQKLWDIFGKTMGYTGRLNILSKN